MFEFVPGFCLVELGLVPDGQFTLPSLSCGTFQGTPEAEGQKESHRSVTNSRHCLSPVTQLTWCTKKSPSWLKGLMKRAHDYCFTYLSQ